MKPFSAGIAAFVLTSAGIALAQAAPTSPPPARGHMRADANGDGVVTRAEFLAQAGARFDRMDANHDGKLTPDEMPRFGRRRGSANGDTPPPPPPGE